MQFYSVIFFVCALSGVFTGLLGIGGGLIIVPCFLMILPLFGITDFSIHQIIGISSTCVFFNSLSTVFYRRHEKFLEKKFLAKVSIFIILGTIFGSWASSFASKPVILSIYVFVSLGSLYLLKKDIHFDMACKSARRVLYFVFAAIGAISATIGIGGAVFFATALKCSFEENTKELLPSITLVVALHALFAFLSKFALGEVTVFIIPVAILASMAGSIIGVKISKKLSANTITNLMITVLLLSIARVIYEFFVH